MKLGDSGKTVILLQESLKRHGFKIESDGIFGKKTEEAVREFQSNNGLIPDGIVGPHTLDALDKKEINKNDFSFGKCFYPREFETYIQGIEWTAWKPQYIVIHHCAEPSLLQRPNGFEYQHMVNLKDFYKSKGWSAGPHLFIDDDQVWTFSPLTSRGIHAVSFNSNSIGIEMLGNYDSEDPKSGRGYNVIQTTVAIVKLLLKRLQLDKSCIRFHRDDPKTSKTCPGNNITKEWFLSLL